MNSVIDALGQPTQLPLIRTVALLPGDVDQFDVPAIALDERPNPGDHDLDLFFGDHSSLHNAGPSLLLQQGLGGDEPRLDVHGHVRQPVEHALDRRAHHAQASRSWSWPWRSCPPPAAS